MAFDDAYDGIAIATGATGKELEGLQQSFRNVVGSVPVDFETAGAAISSVTQRLGDTGGDIDALAIQFANLARITGTDVSTNVSAAADALRLFGVPAQEQSAAIDALFAASQQAGVSFDKMAADVAKSAPQMDMLGLSLDQSAGLMATLSKAGLDAGPILKGMTKFAADGGKAFGDLALEQDELAKATKRAEDAQAAYDAAIAAGMAGTDEMVRLDAELADALSYVDEQTRAVEIAQQAAASSSGPMLDGMSSTLATLAEMGPGADQTAMALDLFGKKAGPELLLALNSGLIGVDDLTSGLSNMGPGINDTASSTDDLQQKFDLLKNKVMLAAEGLAPLGMTLAPISGMLPMIGGAIGGVLPLLGGLASTITGSVIPAVISLAAPFLPVILAVGAVVAIVAALKYAWDHNLGGIQEKVAEWRASLATSFETAKAAVSGAVETITQKLGEAKDWIVEHKDMIVNALLLLAGPIGALAVLWREKGDEIKAALAEIAERIQGWVDDARAAFEDMQASIQEKVDAARAFLEDTWAAIQTYVADKIEAIRVGISEGWTRIQEFLTGVLTRMLEVLRQAWTDMLNAVQSALDGIQSVVDTVLSWMERTFGLKLDLVKQIVSAAFDFMRNSIAEAIYLVQGIIDGLLQFLQGDFQGGVRTVIDSVVGFFRGMAENVRLALDALRVAVEEGVRRVVAVFQPVIDKIQELTGIDLYAVGTALLEGLQQGIRDAVGHVQGALEWLASHLPEWVKRALGMSSPSKVMREIGQDAILGFELGLRDGFRDAMQAAVVGVEEIVTTIAQAVWGQRLVRDAGRAVRAASGRGLYQRFTGSFGAGPTMPLFGLPGAIPRAPEAPIGPDAIETTGRDLGVRVGVSLLEYIRTAPFGAILGNSLADWMRRHGYDEETIANYRDLHKMRGEYGWLTREAAALHRRRTILVGGDWTGATGEVPHGGLTPTPIIPRRYEGDLPKRPSGAAHDPVSVNLANGRVQGDMNVRESSVFQIVLDNRVIDAIAVEVSRRLSGSLIVKPITGTP